MRLDTAAFNCPEKECTATIPGTEKSNLDSEAVDQPEIKPDNPYFFKKKTVDTLFPNMIQAYPTIYNVLADFMHVH